MLARLDGIGASAQVTYPLASQRQSAGGERRPPAAAPPRQVGEPAPVEILDLRDRRCDIELAQAEIASPLAEPAGALGVSQQLDDRVGQRRRVGCRNEQ